MVPGPVVAALGSSSSEVVVVVDILSFLGSGSGSCGGGGDLVFFVSALSIFSGLCGVCRRWRTYPLQFLSVCLFRVYCLYPRKTLVSAAGTIR